jgi:hypothetical protein
MATTDNISVPVSDTDTSVPHEHSCNDPTHNHHHDYDQTNFLDQMDLLNALANAGKKESPAQRKTKKKQKPNQGAVLAETIPGNRGNESIDDLLNYINGPSKANDKKPKKKSA